MLLEETKSNKTDVKADNTKRPYDKIRQLEDKMMIMERKLLTLNNTVEIQSKNLSTLIENIDNKNTHFNKSLTDMFVEVNSLRHNQSLIIKYIDEQKNTEQETVKIKTVNHHGAQVVLSKKQTNDQSTQTDSIPNNNKHINENILPQNEKPIKKMADDTKQTIYQPYQNHPGTKGYKRKADTTNTKDIPTVIMPNGEPTVETNRIRKPKSNSKSKAGMIDSIFVSNYLKEDSTKTSDNKTRQMSGKNEPSSKPTGKQSQYRKRKCLFVHDATLTGFDNHQFSRQFDVDTFQSKSIAFLAKDNRFKDRIKKTSPECIFVHVGLHDVLNNRKKQDIMKDYNKIMWYLLEETESQIVFSTIISTAGTNHLNSKIVELNQSIEEMVGEARSDNLSHNRYCLFTYNNNSVAYHNRRLPEGVKLSDIGVKIMWRRLADGFIKGLRLERNQLNRSQHQTLRSHNRSSAIYD